jgi:hypothetical protein
MSCESGLCLLSHFQARLFKHTSDFLNRAIEKAVGESVGEKK